MTIKKEKFDLLKRIQESPSEEYSEIESLLILDMMKENLISGGHLSTYDGHLFKNLRPSAQGLEFMETYSKRHATAISSLLKHPIVSSVVAATILGGGALAVRYFWRLLG